jgi:hypothetical protein
MFIYNKTTMPKKRCAFPNCKTKITLVQQQMACRCGLCFCTTHSAPENHCCTFNYRKTVEEQKEAETQLKCVAAKIEVI